MRLLKRIVLIFLSLLLVAIVTVALATWYLFSGENLTPIVNKKASDFLNCETTISKVEPTFFSTYPFFGIEIINLCLKDSDANSPSGADTLVYAKKCLASLDVKSYLFDNNIILNPFFLEDGFVNFKIDSLKRSNLDILKTDDSQPTEETSSSAMGDIDVDGIEFKNFRANYSDASEKMEATIKNLNAEVSCQITKDIFNVDVKVDLNQLLFSTSDSLALNVDAKNSNMQIAVRKKSDSSYNTTMQLFLPKLSVAMAGETLLSDMQIKADMPLVINADTKSSAFDKVEISFNDQMLTIAGAVQMFDDNSVSTDVKYFSNDWDVEKLISLVPQSYSASISGLKVKGYGQLWGTVKGVMSDNSYPVVVANVKYNDGQVKYTDIPTVSNINTTILAKVDMNVGQMSDVYIHPSTFKLKNSLFSVNGQVSDFMGTPKYDIKADGQFYLADFQSFVPKELDILLNGKVKGNVHTKFSQADIDNELYHHIYMNGDFDSKKIAISLGDTTNIKLPEAKFYVRMHPHQNLNKDNKLISFKVVSPLMDIAVSPEMNVNTQSLIFAVEVNDMVDELSVPISSCSYKFDKFSVVADTIKIISNDAIGRFVYAPTRKGEKEVADIKTRLNSKNITLLSRDKTLFDVKKFDSNTAIVYDPSESNLMLQWSPDIAMSFTDGSFYLDEKLNGKIPNTSFTINPDTMEIKKANIILGNSDFNLSGLLTNIKEYINKKAVLKGDFNFTSDKTDINELMDIFSGMGVEDSTMVETKQPETADATQQNDGPFIVPKGIDLHLNTKISSTVVNNNVIENIKGGLSVKDGALVLEQMGFTSKAANMQLTAIYRSERENHLFSSIDFHLLNINIEELINLVPYVDTMVPMLKSFKGTGEFHLAGEAFMFKDYSLKKSTLRGAAAFQGQDLTLMDNETFSMIAKKLMFNKKTQNKVDSLSVEMTLFRDEIDLYPFLIVMDDYKAVIAGRHNMDNSFDYHVSVTDCPLPVRLGLNIKGTVDNLQYNLVDCKYKNLYRPDKQGAVEKQTLRLKKMISNSLKQNVKEIE